MADISFESLGNGIRIAVSDDFSFGADALLLSRFSAPKSKDIAIDFCSGCGIIPLRWFGMDSAPAKAYTVEIGPEAFRLLELSTVESKLENRFFPIIADLRDTAALPHRGAVDIVTCNPPYGKSGAGRPPESERDLIARHEQCCTFDEVCAAAASLLRQGGRFCFCHRPSRMIELLETLRQYRLEPKRMRFVQQRTGKEPWLLLMEAVKCGKPFLKVEPTFLMEDSSGNPTPDAIAAGVYPRRFTEEING